MPESAVYKIIFHHHNQLYEIYAKQLYQSDLYGFIEIEEYAFNKRSGKVVDPAEERLKAEFQDVRRSYIPMHLIVRIDEVEETGASKISPAKGNLKLLAMPASLSPQTQRGDSD